MIEVKESVLTQIDGDQLVGLASDLIRIPSFKGGE